jgi:hypothetical protein
MIDPEEPEEYCEIVDFDVEHAFWPNNEYPNQHSGHDSPEYTAEVSEHGLVYRALDVYFRPKRFESQRLYEKIGIKQFKKFLLPTGDLLNRYVWHGRANTMSQSGTRLQRVQALEFTTRTVEGVHWAMFSYFHYANISENAFSTFSGAAKATAIQLGVNIYPIMVQRYNRIRALRILERQKS